MTLWSALLDGCTGPKYVAITEAIARRIESGELPPGARLPPQRDLARELGITVGTVTRAYGEARRRGLLTGEVGRGTFVRPRPRGGDRCFGLTPPGTPGQINLAHNSPDPGCGLDLLQRAVVAWSADLPLIGMLGYVDHAGAPRHREAGAAWLARGGVPCDPDDVVLTAGTQHGMLLAASVLAEPGDLVLTEALTYPGMRAIAHMLRMRLEGVATDEHGLRPDAFEQACRRGPKLVYCTPTIQNPTATVMPLERRRSILEIAQAHGVTVVEDDCYGFLPADAPPAMARLTNHGVCYLTGLSKCLAPGLRLGFLRAPAGRAADFAQAVMTTTIMASPITADLAATLIENGVAEQILQQRRQQAAARQRMLRAMLGNRVAPGVSAESAHAWLLLPEPWRTAELCAEAEARGVAVAPSEAFVVGRVDAPHAIRLSLGAAGSDAELERGLRVLAELFESSPTPTFAGP